MDAPYSIFIFSAERVRRRPTTLQHFKSVTQSTPRPVNFSSPCVPTISAASSISTLNAKKKDKDILTNVDYSSTATQTKEDSFMPDSTYTCNITHINIMFSKKTQTRFVRRHQSSRIEIKRLIDTDRIDYSVLYLRTAYFYLLCALHRSFDPSLT
ncbi:uncharacterized protein LOC143235846 [Tachypleus tridentatus]|uniref:uncharacterized protein LOC143235846 n=1 Tax=Tachypleus tridentatus TaxID=6853 RepID=UPI003FD178CC